MYKKEFFERPQLTGSPRVDSFVCTKDRSNFLQPLPLSYFAIVQSAYVVDNSDEVPYRLGIRTCISRDCPAPVIGFLFSVKHLRVSRTALAMQL